MSLNSSGFMQNFDPPLNENDQNSDLTHDAFLDGRITLCQPKSGFRAGIDSVLLASAVGPKAQNICEFGAGGGAAACCLLAQNEKAQMVLVEKQQEILPLLQHNLAQNQFDHRAKVLALDITISGKERVAAGLAENAFDCVIANPPFYIADAGTLANDAKKSQSNHMPRQDLSLWAKAAATCLKASGEIIFIMPADRLSDVLEAFGNRFGAITILPIVPHEGEDAHRVLARGIKGSRAPMTLKSPLVLHNENERNFLPQADAIFRGEARLHW